MTQFISHTLLDRMLDPSNPSLTVASLGKAAAPFAGKWECASCRLEVNRGTGNIQPIPFVIPSRLTVPGNLESASAAFSLKLESPLSQR
jgi:hypothetical protein